MSREQQAAELLRRALEQDEVAEEGLDPALRREVEEALGAAAFIQSFAATSLNDAFIQEVEQEAMLRQAASAPTEEELREAEALGRALSGEVPASAEVERLLGAAAFLQNTSKPALLAESFLAQLGEEVTREAKLRQQEEATPQEQEQSELLRRALSGEQPPASLEAQRQVELALGAAAFLRNTAAPKLLHEAQLAAFRDDVVHEAKSRQQRRRRVTLWGSATLFAVAAALVLVAGPIFRGHGPHAQLEARFPEPPILRQEIIPGSDPLERLDPVYDAGLRGMREARFLGAQHAYQNAQ